MRDIGPRTNGLPASYYAGNGFDDAISNRWSDTGEVQDIIARLFNPDETNFAYDLAELLQKFDPRVTADNTRFNESAQAFFYSLYRHVDGEITDDARAAA